MARKVEPKARRQRGKSTPKANDLDVLFPDRSLPLIGGKAVTVRELRFEEQIQHHALLSRITEDLAAMPLDALESAAGVNLVLDVVFGHWPSLRPLVALSVGESEEWVSDLSGEDGETLVLVWWSVNQGFFIRRLLRPAIAQRALHRAGEKSSPPSSSTDTDAPNSGNTPPVS